MFIKFKYDPEKQTWKWRGQPSNWSLAHAYFQINLLVRPLKYHQYVFWRKVLAWNLKRKDNRLFEKAPFFFSHEKVVAWPPRKPGRLLCLSPNHSEREHASSLTLARPQGASKGSAQSAPSIVASVPPFPSRSQWRGPEMGNCGELLGVIHESVWLLPGWLA